MLKQQAATYPFDRAIRAGVFSHNPDSPAYVGHYMFMGTDHHGDHFKHRTFRTYCVNPLAKPNAIELGE